MAISDMPTAPATTPATQAPRAMSRRTLLKVAGAGAGVLALATGAGVWIESGKSGALTFRAVAGLPGAPLPAYCSYVIEGTLDLTARAGSLTEQMYAGFPTGTSTTRVAWPGFARTIKVTSVRQSGGVITVKGSVTDAASLRPGESSVFQMVIDRAKHTAHGQFLGYAINLTVA
jgi:hypothetical protein